MIFKSLCQRNFKLLKYGGVKNLGGTEQICKTFFRYAIAAVF